MLKRKQLTNIISICIEVGFLKKTKKKLINFIEERPKYEGAISTEFYLGFPSIKFEDGNFELLTEIISDVKSLTYRSDGKFFKNS